MFSAWPALPLGDGKVSLVDDGSNVGYVDPAVRPSGENELIPKSHALSWKGGCDVVGIYRLGKVRLQLEELLEKVVDVDGSITTVVDLRAIAEADANGLHRNA
jgi:hypothetical protein